MNFKTTIIHLVQWTERPFSIRVFLKSCCEFNEYNISRDRICFTIVRQKCLPHSSSLLYCCVNSVSTCDVCDTLYTFPLLQTILENIGEFSLLAYSSCKFGFFSQHLFINFSSVLHSRIRGTL